MAALTSWATSLLDSISQFLSTAPLWIQAPPVMAVVIPLCAAVAVVWLIFIDFCGALVSGNRRPKTQKSASVQPRQLVITGEFD